MGIINTYLIQTRWLLLLLFPIGFLLTEEAYTSQWGYYAILNALSLLATGLVLLRLQKVAMENIVIWLILFVLILGYYIKFYFLVHGIINDKPISVLHMMLEEYFLPSMTNYQLLLNYFETISFSFLAFAITAYFLCRDKQQERKNGNVTIEPDWSKLSYLILTISLLVALISGFFRWFFYLDIPEKVVILPFKIAGMISVTNTYVVPLLIGLALIYAVQSGAKMAIRISLILFIAWGIIQFFLFTSKTFFVIPILWIILISIYFKKPLVNLGYLLLYGILFLFIYPFLNIFRLYHISLSNSDNFISQLNQTINSVISSAGTLEPLQFVINGFFKIGGRVIGLEPMLIFATIRPENNQVLDYLLGFGRSPEIILTEYVATTPNTAFAQSLLGLPYYLTGSSLWTAAFTAGWLLFAYWCGRILYQKAETPLFLCLWVTWIINILMWTTDGISLKKLIFFVVSIIPIILLVQLIDKSKFVKS